MAEMQLAKLYETGGRKAQDGFSIRWTLLQRIMLGQ
jgi:hypothetical protein